MSIGTPYANSAKNLWEFFEVFLDVALLLAELIFW
jgi:hypothetical protein